MSWQQPTPPPTDDEATPAIAVPESVTTSPVIVRTAQGMVFLGLLRGDHRGAGYGHQVVIAWAGDLATQQPPSPARPQVPEQRCSTHHTTYRQVCAGCRADALAAPAQAGTG